MITFLTAEEARNRINVLSQEKTPFLFIIDFEQGNCVVSALDQLPKEIAFSINGSASKKEVSPLTSDFKFRYKPVSFNTYSKGFKKVMSEIQYGNSFLLNLTYPSEVDTDLSLEQIYDHSDAPYKLWIKDKLVVFSPECFIKIQNGIISSYPMKGTIKAEIPGAHLQLLSNEKELAEHYTIVDLIRNDLSQVARKVKVERFRYLQKIKKRETELWQASSEITGVLKKPFDQNIGDLLFTLLPAGSISGAPKKKTVEIIKESEGQNRGFYTGVFGIYDGKQLDSGVMIRCLQRDGDKINYHSGGGITHMSTLDEEYQELIDKIYVPIIRDDMHTRRTDKKSELSSETSKSF